VFATSSSSTRPPVQWGVGIPLRPSPRRGSSSRPTIPEPAAHAGGPPTLDEFINGLELTSGAYVEDVDVAATRNPKRRKLIHQAGRRVAGRTTADQELIDSLSNELETTMQQLQESNVALDNCQQSKTEIRRLQAISRAQRTDFARHVKSSRHDVPPSEVGLVGTQLSNSIYGTVVFDLTFFNEVTKSDNILKSMEANVIDSCIEVIIGLPDIRSHSFIFR
jgi:hypothetical protein